MRNVLRLRPSSSAARIWFPFVAVSAAAIKDSFVYWDDIAVHHKGQRIVSGGHGFAGIGRKQMLIDLQARARELKRHKDAPEAREAWAALFAAVKEDEALFAALV